MSDNTFHLRMSVPAHIFLVFSEAEKGYNPHFIQNKYGNVDRQRWSILPKVIRKKSTLFRNIMQIFSFSCTLTMELLFIPTWNALGVFKCSNYPLTAFYLKTEIYTQHFSWRHNSSMYLWKDCSGSSNLLEKEVIIVLLWQIWSLKSEKNSECYIPGNLERKVFPMKIRINCVMVTVITIALWGGEYNISDIIFV